MDATSIIQNAWQGIALPVLGFVVVFGVLVVKKQNIVMSALIAAIVSAMFVFGGAAWAAFGPPMVGLFQGILGIK